MVRAIGVELAHCCWEDRGGFARRMRYELPYGEGCAGDGDGPGKIKKGVRLCWGGLGSRGISRGWGGFGGFESQEIAGFLEYTEL